MSESVSMKEYARQERTELAEFLATLTPEQWDTPSLCEGWRIRDVVSHMISYDELTIGGVLGRMARGAFSVHRANSVGVDAARERTPEQLLAALNDHLQPRGLTTAFGGMIGFVDGLVHHQDIRRPLGQPREIPADRMMSVLRGGMHAPLLKPRSRTRGLRLVATDLDFTTGTGAEVRGPAEALLMAAVAGRRGVSGELSGPGQPLLAARIGD